MGEVSPLFIPLQVGRGGSYLFLGRKGVRLVVRSMLPGGDLVYFTDRQVD